MIAWNFALRFEPSEPLGLGKREGFIMLKYCLLMTMHCAALTGPPQLGESYDNFSPGSDRDRLRSSAD
jgi:hypothetical protein